MRVDVGVDKFICISGGEFSDEYGDINEYCIQFDDINISIKSKLLKEMTIEAVNHLIVNGHDFEFIFSQTGQRELK